jgi:hypothetical protein
MTKNKNGNTTATFPCLRRLNAFFWKEFGDRRNNVNITYFLSISNIVWNGLEK